MLTILIGHSYFARFDRKQLERAKPYPPLATLHVASQLRRAGHRVALFDAMLAEGTVSYQGRLEEVQPHVVLFYEDNFNYLSKMCLGRMRQASCEMIASARQAGARVIAAGSDVSDMPETYLAAGAHAVLKGEGLASLSELLRRLAADMDVPIAQWINGLDDVLVRVEDQPAQSRSTASPGISAVRFAAKAGSDLAEQVQHDEAPAWDLVDVARYRDVWRQAHGYFSLNMAASKGCSFRCAWCAKPIWGNRYRQRSATAVAAEMAWLKRSLQPDHIWFADDIFGFRTDWVRGFAQALQAEGGGIPFTIQTRADLLSESMAQALKEAGCSEAWIGAESGSQSVLDAMHKGTTVEELLIARARLRDQGIRVGFFIQLGYLGEQLDDILATRRLIDDARPDEIGVSVSYPLPGTPFHEQVKAQLGDKTRWNESGDLAMMFEGTYSSDFYRAVRDLLHAQVDAQKLGDRDKAGSRYRRARAAVQQRWKLLIAQERRFRTVTRPLPLPTTAHASA